MNNDIDLLAIAMDRYDACRLALARAEEDAHAVAEMMRHCRKGTRASTPALALFFAEEGGNGAAT